jgi:hypothetical protein
MKIITLLLCLVSSAILAQVPIVEKPRLVVLTDIGGDPDNQMFMVRLMTYSNQIYIEGLIATATGRVVNADYIKQIVSAYNGILQI